MFELDVERALKNAGHVSEVCAVQPDAGADDEPSAHDPDDPEDHEPKVKHPTAEQRSEMMKSLALDTNPQLTDCPLKVKFGSSIFEHFDDT